MTLRDAILDGNALAVFRALIDLDEPKRRQLVEAADDFGPSAWTNDVITELWLTRWTEEDKHRHTVALTRHRALGLARLFVADTNMEATAAYGLALPEGRPDQVQLGYGRIDAIVRSRRPTWATTLVEVFSHDPEAMLSCVRELCFEWLIDGLIEMPANDGFYEMLSQLAASRITENPAFVDAFEHGLRWHPGPTLTPKQVIPLVEAGALPRDRMLAAMTAAHASGAFRPRPTGQLSAAIKQLTPRARASRQG